MRKPYSKADWRKINARKAAAIEEDRGARAARLIPEIVELWTEIIKQALPNVSPGDRPCSYRPWAEALGAGSKDYRWAGAVVTQPVGRAESLMWIATDIAQPGWPEPRRDLIEFALVFLEADVMLFRSGYTKRHLIRRLQQSPLSEADVRRAKFLLKRAVVVGTGLEEQRAYRKLAAHLVCQGHLQDLSGWLRDAASGAVITVNGAEGSDYFKMLMNPELSDRDLDRLVVFDSYGRPKSGFLYPEMSSVVRAGENLVRTDQRIKRNAYRMLRAIEARERSRPK
ncbi:hypothetical protein AADZ90_000775 [Aestuariibius sp. 2305UL40-4]|uniref:hypothetical protein n=1 Tax=Aestuariibius violaceus TaxID=3234132 RepID=UPI00345E3347